MAEYTPTTLSVREEYIEGPPYDPYNPDENWASRAFRFDRWLASERANAVRDFALHTLPTEWRQRALEHADNIRKGET